MPREVWKPVVFDESDRAGLSGLKAVLAGVANADQQRAAMDLILTKIAGVHELSYRPDSLGGDRDTAFCEGRRFVGLSIQKVGVVPMERLIGKTKGD